MFSLAHSLPGRGPSWRWDSEASPSCCPRSTEAADAQRGNESLARKISWTASATWLHHAKPAAGGQAGGRGVVTGERANPSAGRIMTLRIAGRELPNTSTPDGSTLLPQQKTKRKHGSVSSLTWLCHRFHTVKWRYQDVLWNVRIILWNFDNISETVTIYFETFLF